MRRAAALLAGAFLLLTVPAQAPRPTGVDMAVVLAEAPARTLAEYGLFQDAAAREPSARVTPYDLATPLFSDYAAKHRFVFTPPGTAARYTPEGPLDFPTGSVLVKTFAYPAAGGGERFLETRLLIRKASGWTAQAYVWNEAQTEAVLKRAGARIPIAFTDPSGAAHQIDYLVPNQNQCKECHSADGELVPIGPRARNLNRSFAYSGGTQNQLAHWSRIGLLEGAPAPSRAPRTAAWDDTAEPLEARARAYLDANCGHCHNPSGMASTSGLNLHLEENDPAKLGVRKRPVAAGRGSGGLEFAIAPGEPDSSILYFRMASTDPGVMMPELGREVPHAEGLALVRAYINSIGQTKQDN